MITYFIINKLGTVIYQSKYNSNNISTNITINETNRIRYLPLLVIKDLIKASLNDTIQYIKINNKTIAFKEQQNLLYVACTKKNNIHISLLQLHLKVMHNFIKFHYGPHWSLQVLGNNNQKTKTVSISKSDLYACLSQLPFLCSTLSTRSCDALCSSEQVQVSDDLRFRLVENLTNFCNAAFIYQYTNQQQHQHQHHHHRNTFFSSTSSSKSNNNKPTSYIFDSYLHHHHHHHHLDNNLNPFTTWSYCFLFAREKLVAQCHNPNGETKDKNELQDEFIYYLKLLVSRYLQEKRETGAYHSDLITTTLPQNISSSSSSTTTKIDQSPSTTTITPTTTILTTFNNNLSPSSSKSETSTTYTNNSFSQPSSLAYVYDANSNSAPFKIREKSASSVTVVSSDSSISYWSNPFSNNNTPTHHLAHPMKSLDIQRTPSNVVQPHIPYNQQTQQSLISDLLNGEESANNISFLSSSVPSDSTATVLNATANNFSYSNRNPYMNKVSSAPSSPTHRSRSQSLSTNSGNEDTSLKCILTNLINGETGYLDQTEDVKLVRRWMKLDGRVYLANFILILINDGLCAVIVCKDDPEKLIKQNGTKPNISPPSNNRAAWKPTSIQVKRFKATLRSYLSDFNTFLLTKEATHFTNLSFAVTYPGLVHFMYFNRGIMTAPSLVDLNELDKNHELLHEVYVKYNLAITDRCKWVWPNEHALKKLCNQMLQLGLCCRQDQMKNKAIQESSDREYYYLYQRGANHQELLAIYFSIIPPDRLWIMHQKLFNDIGQRV